MKAPCRQCGIDEPDHNEDCPVRLRAEKEKRRLREIVAHALVLAYRDARREGVPLAESYHVRGVLRELDSLYERASWDPPPERDGNVDVVLSCITELERVFDEK